MRIKKGSRNIRSILENNQNSIVSPNMLIFGELTETIINVDSSIVLNSSWGITYLHNSARTFIFKLHNASLGLNSRVAHFVRNHPNTCIFCDIGQIQEENVGSTKHLFFECNYVENLLSEFYKWAFNEENLRYPTRTEFFIGFDTGDTKKDKVLHIVNLLVKKFIWDCKLRSSIPNIIDLSIYWIRTHLSNKPKPYLQRNCFTIRPGKHYCQNLLLNI